MNLVVIVLPLLLSAADSPVVGKDVILPCHLEFIQEISTVEWKSPNNTFVHVYRDGRDYLDDQEDRFKGRTSLFHEEMTTGNFSLKFSGLQRSDEGTYTCKVRLEDGWVFKRPAFLKVEKVSSEPRGGMTKSPPSQTNNSGGDNSGIGIGIGISGIVIVIGLCAWRKCRKAKITGGAGQEVETNELERLDTPPPEEDESTAAGSTLTSPLKH